KHQPVVVDLLHEKRERDGDPHPHRRDPVAGARGARMRQPLDADDEEDRRDEVRDVDPGLAQRPSSSRSGRRCFKISGMRSVTRKPPTMLIVPNTTATNPSTCSSVESAVPTISIAPTSTMPWIAFVPDINGVCSIVGTFEITSKPTKIASAKMVSSATSCALTPAPPRAA